MALQGGNDSYGTGLSAGGAQVMGQSKGLDELVKYGMARAKQRMQRPIPVSTPQVNLDQIKRGDMQSTADDVEKMRNLGYTAYQSYDPVQKGQAANEMNHVYAGILARNAQSKEDNALAGLNWKNLHESPNVDQRVIDDYDTHYNKFLDARTGSPEAEYERQFITSKKYQAYNPIATQNMLAKFAQDKQTSEISDYKGGATLTSIQKSRVADGGAMMNAMKNVIAGNDNAKFQYQDKGNDFMRNPANAKEIARYAKEYHIDPTKSEEVGAAMDVAFQKRNMDKYNVDNDRVHFPSKGININTGVIQPEASNEGPSNVSVDLNGTHADGSDFTTNANFNYAQKFGINHYRAGIGGEVYDLAQNKLVKKLGMSDVSLVGSLNPNFYNPGVKRAVMENDRGGRETSVQAKNEDGSPKFEDAQGGLVSARDEKYYRNHPEKAGEISNKDPWVHIISREIGLDHHYLVHRSSIPDAAFPSTKKGWQGQADGAARATNQEAVKKNNAKSLPEIKI